MKKRLQRLLSMLLVLSMLLGTLPTAALATDDLVAGGGTSSQTPTGDGTTPTGDGTTPTGDGTTPTGDGTTPTGDGTTPTGDGTTPAGDGTTPTGDGTTPTDDGTTPAGDGTTPTGDGTTPTGDGTTPTGDGTTPAGDTSSLQKSTRLTNELLDNGDEEYTPSTDKHIFTVDANGTLTKVTNLDGSLVSGEVVIPKTVALEGEDEPVTVTAIGSAALQGKTGVTKITIPNTVTEVVGGTGNWHQVGFKGCLSLTEVVFEDGPGDPLQLGGYVFQGLTALEKVTLPTQRQCIIGDPDASNAAGVFLGCKALKDINLGESQTTYISKTAFSGCTALTEVTLPASVYDLGTGAMAISEGSFYNCTGLETVTFLSNTDAPAESLAIGKYAFRGCGALASVVLPTDRPLTVQNSAFADCAKLASINSADCNFVEIGSKSFANTALTEFTVTNVDATIKEDAFNSETPITVYGPLGSALQACAVNDNVTYAALGLEEDENLLIQDGFVVDKTTGVIRQYIGDVKELTIPAEIGGVTITGIDPYALTGKDFTYINLQIPLTELPNNLFAGLGNLASITLPETITSVGESAFENCASLLNITFGANSKLTSIGDYAFSGCVMLTGIDLPDTLETIGYRAFYQTAFVSLGLPASIQSIGDYAFMNMTSLQTMDLSSVSADASLGKSLFSGCSALENVTLPANLTAIGQSWFQNCTALKELEIPATVQEIGMNAFWNTGLESLTIPEGVTTLNNVIRQCYDLKTLKLPSTLTALSLASCSSLESVDLPATLTTLGTFSGCSSLKEVVIPEGVTSLVYNAFTSCTALEAVYIPASVTKIGYGTGKNNIFDGCDVDSLVIYTTKGSTADTELAGEPYNVTKRSYPENEITLSVQGAQSIENVSKTATVSKTAAEDANLTDQLKSYQVSVLDALVTAHTSNGMAVAGNLAIDSSGKVTKVFGVQTASSGFILNGEPLTMDKAASTKLLNGDTLQFFTGVTEDGQEQGIAWLEFLDGNLLKLAKDRAYTFRLTTANGPLAGLEVRKLDNQGAIENTPLGTTGADGTVDLTFTEEGTYIITGYDAQNRYIFTRTTVTVYDPDLSLGSLAVQGSPAFDTSTKLANGYYAGQLVWKTETADDPNGETDPNAGSEPAGDPVTDAGTGFDASQKEYIVYTNANTNSVLLSGVKLQNTENATLKLLTITADGTVVDNVKALPATAEGAYAIPFVPFTGDELTLRLDLAFTENGQTFTDSYTIYVERFTGAMEASANIVDIQGANRTALAAPFYSGVTSTLALYYDYGMTSGALDVTVDEGTSLAVNGEPQTDGTNKTENGRAVTVYRVNLDDLKQSYTLTTSRGEESAEVTISSASQRSIYEGVYTPDRVVGIKQAPGQFTTDNPSANSTLRATTAWSKYVSLGGFGGYVDYYYEDPIVDDPRNPYGVDFIVYGNAFSAGGAGEAAGVKVSEDGVTWYDLAGQRHYELSTYYDTATLRDGSSIESLLITRTGEYGHESGYPSNVTFGYADVAACSENLYAEGTYYVKATAGNPYIASGSTIGDGMDLAWAVDKDGKPVDLSGKEIHYIRVQNVVDVPANGSFGEVSTEIGTLTKINPSSQQENVGVTAEPEILAMGESLPEAVSSLKDGAISYYEIDLEKHGFPMVSVTGAEDDVIYVNMEQYTGSAEYIGLPDENGERTVRILVQNGKCEPRIYVIHFTNANDPTTSTELASIIANDTIRLTEDTNGGYSGTVMNLNSYVAFNIRSLNPQAAIELRAGNGEYTTVTYGKNTETYPLSVGSNLFTVRVTAVDGSQKEYPMVVTRQSADSSSTESKNITVKFTFTGDTIHYVDENNLGTHTGDTWIATQSVTVPKGSTVKDVTDAMLQNAQIDFVTTNNGTYISEVQIPSGFPGAGEYLAEFSNGPNSGWMYRVNNKIADVGYAAKQLSNGDAILWFYTDDYTQIPAKDYENYDPSWGSGSSSSATTTKEEITVELTPEATVNSNGEAKAEVADKEIDAAVASAKKDNADAIIIAPEVKGDADKVTVELSKDAVGSIAKETDAALAIQTEIAEITVPNSGLAELNQQSGSKVTFSAETVTGEDGKETGEVKIEIKVDSSAINQLDSGVVVSLPAANKNSGNVLAIVNSDGSQTLVKKSVVEGNNVKAIVDGSVTVKIIDNSKDFTDMAGHWAADAVDFVTSRELFNGTNEGIFSPSEQMTRAMLVTVLHRLEDEPAATATTEFSDVAADSWYAEAVAWASQQKIVNGTGDNLFSPEQSISREELATMLYRYADVLDMDMTAGENAMADFQDAGQVSDWAKEAMNWAVSNGFITGKTNATLDAGNTATRAEVAAILQRMVEWMVQ